MGEGDDRFGEGVGEGGMMTDSEEREWERGDDDRFGGEGVGEGGMMTDSEEREWERGG